MGQDGIVTTYRCVGIDALSNREFNGVGSPVGVAITLDARNAQYLLQRSESRE